MHVRATRENLVNQPEHIGSGDGARENYAEDRVVNRRKALHNVGLQDIRIALCELLRAVEGAMRAFAFAIGVGIENKLALEQRLDKIRARDARRGRGRARRKSSGAWHRPSENY